MANKSLSFGSVTIKGYDDTQMNFQNIGLKADLNAETKELARLFAEVATDGKDKAQTYRVSCEHEIKKETGFAYLTPDIIGKLAGLTVFSYTDIDAEILDEKGLLVLEAAANCAMYDLMVDQIKIRHNDAPKIERVSINGTSFIGSEGLYERVINAFEQATMTNKNVVLDLRKEGETFKAKPHKPKPYGIFDK